MAQTLTSAAAEQWAIGIFVLAVFGLCTFMMLASWLLGGRSHGREKAQPFESGISGAGGPRLKFSVKFYLVAMLFVIFDIEAVYLFVWAVSLPESGWTGFWAATIFVGILLAGLLYDSRTGALDWAPRR